MCSKGKTWKWKTHKAVLKKEMPSYFVWTSMHDRCKYFYSNNNCNKPYILKGITVCDEWKDFYVFYDWAMKNGYQKHLRIDRIDNKKGYSPDNCRFVTVKENNRNKDNTIFWEFNGLKKTIGEWAETLMVKPGTLRSRLYKNRWSVERILSTPIKSYKTRKIETLQP